MRWLKRSAREEILRDIHLGKKGELGTGESSTASSSGGEKKSFFSRSSSSSGGGGGVGKTLLIIFLIVLFLIGGIVGLGYVQSESGQRGIQEGIELVRSYTVDPIADFMTDLYSFGSGEHFSQTINSSSSKKGVDLESLSTVSGQEVLPAGSDIDLQYEFSFENVKSTESFDVDFSCYFNYTVEEEEDEITVACDDDSPCEESDHYCISKKCVEMHKIEGDISPASSTSIRKGSTVLCQFDGEETEELDGAYTFYGWFDFEYETVDATLNVYFISIDTESVLEMQEEEFFDAFDLDVKSSDLKVVYNGEPIGIGIGVGEEGKEGQPVVVGDSDIGVYNTIGITLDNKWNGDIKELEDVRIYLPDGITINEEQHDEPSLSCPFVDYGTHDGMNMYVMDDEVKDQLFDFYIAEQEFFGEQDKHTFQCWIDIESDFVGSASYKDDVYIAEAEYTYTVKPASETLTIKGTGESLVTGIDDDEEEEEA